MMIRELAPAGGVLVEMSPDDCYTLATACRIAAEELCGFGNGNPREAHLYDLLEALLEGYALAGSAKGYIPPKDCAKFTVEAVHAAWSTAPSVRGGGR
jgi:hypothetical protein